MKSPQERKFAIRMIDVMLGEAVKDGVSRGEARGKIETARNLLKCLD